MKQKLFVSQRGRPINIRIDDYISFRFPNERDREFYWIEKEDWARDAAHWENHMANKLWFSPAMATFINKSIKETIGNS
jgi:hypothetical protein